MLRRAAVATLLMLSPCAAAAQEPDRFTPPIAGSWEPIQSMGQPPLWRPFLGFGFGVDGPGDEWQAGPTGSIGVYRDLGNPMYGILGMSAQVYAGQRGERFDAGARLMLGAPLLYVHGGLDWNTRWDRRDLNKDVRGMALDGEVLAVVAGRWALQPYIDFFLLSGAVTWIDSIEALDGLMPPSSVLKRWIGRRLRRIM